MAGTLRRMIGILFNLALVLGFVPANAQPTFPTLTGRIVDAAHLLGPADEQALIADLKKLEERSSDQVVVVTLPSLQGYAIEDYGYQLAVIGASARSSSVTVFFSSSHQTNARCASRSAAASSPSSPTRCRESLSKMPSCPASALATL